MKKHLLLFLIPFLTLISTQGFAQCPTDSVLNMYLMDGGNFFAYIDEVRVDNVVISSGSGFQSSGPSYQAFQTPVIQLQQNGSHTIDILGNANAQYAIGVWLDLNGNHVFESNEKLVEVHDQFINSFYSVNFSLAPDAVSDTFDLRIVKMVDGTGNMFLYTDACNFTNQGGEVEDYKAFINCNYSPQWTSFDPIPMMCEMPGSQIQATSPYGQLYWYNDTNLAPIDSGDFLTFNALPFDTTFYVQNVIGGCASIMNPIFVTVLPAPVVNIAGPDTVYSCSAVSLDAGPGFMIYQWSTGDMTQVASINSGTGGYVSVYVVDGSTGCAATDQVWVAIAPDPPSTYSYVVPDMNICSNYTASLVYDSLVDPGTCSWYETSSGNFIGTGSNIQVIFPDTGYYQYTAYINSMCGLDTAYITYHFQLQAHLDSLYAIGGIRDANGLAVFCAGGSDVTVIAGGFDGIVDYWELLDITNVQSLTWGSNNDTIYVPVGMMTQGDLYGIVLHMFTQQGCPSISDTLFGMISTPSGINLPDTTWKCSLPSTVGPLSSNYSVFDVLWNTGDTTFQISVPAVGNYSVTATDVTTGCITTQSTYVADGSISTDIFPDTTISCLSQVHFDFSPYGIGIFQWDEYSPFWNPMNQYFDPFVDIFDQGTPEYLVATGWSSHMCVITDTTYILFNGTFTFDLGPNVSTAATSYTITGPYYPNYIYTWMPGNIHTSALTVTTNGTYSLTIDNGQGCNYTDVITVNFTTGIEHNNLTENNFSLSPNPADDHLVVNSTIEIIDAVNIYDAQGRIVFSKLAEEKGRMEINTSSLSNGYYFVEIVSGENRFEKKLVISR